MGSAGRPIDEQLGQSLKEHESRLWDVSSQIHSHPELGFEETFAHNTICDALEELGYKVTRHAYGMQTSFEAEAGSGGALIVYNAEIDALPGIGHACGHNLIATSSLAAFLATAEAMRNNGIEGRVRLLGTPAEEGGGGKIDLLEAGAYKGVDACLMGHPGPFTGATEHDGVVLTRTMARAGATVRFHGVNAHAGNAPWQGKNALDAAVAAYTNISMLRQQTPPNQRVHAIISKGGDVPNIIPDLAEIQLYARAENITEVEASVEKLVQCCEGAAKAAGCKVEFKWVKPYKELECSETIAKKFQQNASNQGINYAESMPAPTGASTDQGNVSFELPALHPGFLLEVDNPDVGPHHPDFAKTAATKSSFERALRFAKAMAATGLNILQDKDMRNKMWEEHREKFKNRRTADRSHL